MGWTIESTADPMAAGIAAARGGQDASAAAGTEALDFWLANPLYYIIILLPARTTNLWKFQIKLSRYPKEMSSKTKLNYYTQRRRVPTLATTVPRRRT